MFKKTKRTILTIAAIAALAAGGSAVPTAFAKHGADDPVTHNRGDDNGGKRAKAARHGADDGPGHVRHGADDGPNHR